MPGKPQQIRLCFAALEQPEWLTERARGLARYLGPDIQVSQLFIGTRGLRGSWRGFRSLLQAGRKAEVLYLISMHPVRVLAAWLARLLFKSRFVVDTGDLLYEQAKTRGDARWRCWFTSGWEAICLRLPDALVVRGSLHLRLLVERGFHNVTFIPDGVDPASLRPMKNRRLRDQLGLKDKITVGILATVGWDPHLRLPSPGWDLVACLARLPELPLHGLVIGDGPGLPQLKELCRTQGLEDRVTFLGRVPYAELPACLGLLDICLHTALNNRMSMVRTTGKLPVLLACGGCLVVSAVGEATRVLKDTGMLLPFDGTPEEYGKALAARVRRLVTEGNFDRYRQRGPEIVRREFAYQVLSQRVEDLVQRLVNA